MACVPWVGRLYKCTAKVFFHWNIDWKTFETLEVEELAGYITASERRFAPDVVFALRPRLDSSTHQVSTDTPELDSYSWNSQYCLFSFILGISLSLFTPELDSYSFFRFFFQAGISFSSEIQWQIKYFFSSKIFSNWYWQQRFAFMEFSGQIQLSLFLLLFDTPCNGYILEIWGQ